MMQLPIQVDATTLPALIFGGILVVIALVMSVFVWRARQAFDPVVENEARARLHAERQFRRRIQVSGMLALVGILIPLGDQLFVRRPLLFFVWIACIFFLVLWMILMALGDWLSTVAYSAVERSRLQNARKELENELQRYQASKNGHVLNGHVIDDAEDSLPT